MSAQLDIFETPSYYNTNKLSGSDLAKAQAAGEGQELAILRFFQARPGQLLTPEDASGALSARTPLTSVRRAITNLTMKGLLSKTERMRLGKYSKPIHFWRLNDLGRAGAMTAAP